MSQPVRPLICCHHCKGHGQLPLSDELWDTLTTLRKMKAASSEMIAKEMKWPGHVTTFNNRLKYLMDLGFATRHKAGKMYVYKPA